MAHRRALRWQLAFWAIALAFLVVGPSSVLLAAPSSAALSVEAERELRVMARDDVRNAAGRRTTDAVNAARETWPGLNVIEARRTYDDEFTRQAKKETGGIGNVIKQNRTLVVIATGVIFALGMALRDTLAKLFSAMLKWLGRSVYTRLGGTKPFRQIALRRYRTALEKLLGRFTVTFRPNKPLDMGEIYVPLRVAGATGLNSIEACEALGSHRRLMVIGPPGSGKSMLLRHIAYSYAKGRMVHLPERPIPVLLELHRLKGQGLTPTVLLGELVSALGRADFPKAQNFLVHGLEQGFVLLLFDGLDEVASADRGAVIQVIKDTLAQYQKCRAVVTCRSAAYHNELHETVDQTLEIVEFTDQQVRRFLRAWMLGAPPDKSVQELVQNLRDRPQIQSLGRNPLLLTMLAYLYTDTPFVLPHSRVEFYEKATEVLLGLRDEERCIANKYRTNDKRRVLQHLGLSFQDDASADQSGDRRSRDSKEVRNLVKSVLPFLDLKAEDAQPLIDEIVERSGLLLSIDHGRRIQFAHLTIQEFFAAAALRDAEAELLRRVMSDLRAWREPAKLWCGQAANSADFLTAIWMLDPLLTIECLADAAEVSEELANRILADAQRRLNNSKEPEAYSSAIGALAASPRPRGKQTFDFLVGALHEEAPRAAAARALSQSNLPQAAETLEHRSG